MPLRFFFLLCVIFASSPARAERVWGKRTPRTYVVLFDLVGDYQFAKVVAAPPAVSLSRNYGSPIVVGGGTGIRFSSGFFFMLRYEYWIATRDTVTAKELLRHQSLGGELGFHLPANPRLSWRIAGAVLYPLQAGVESAGTEYSASGTPLTYEGRLGLGFKLVDVATLLVEGGYRYSNLGQVSGPAGPYLSGGADLDLSGAFAGLRFLFHF